MASIVAGVTCMASGECPRRNSYAARRSDVVTWPSRHLCRQPRCQTDIRSPRGTAARSPRRSVCHALRTSDDGMYKPISSGGSGVQPADVYLVGTGPGDPELLTLKAHRLMQTADVVMYDRLVSEDILQMIHAGARMVYVGKESGFHTRTQEEIHAMMLDFSSAGQSVLRLKGGDPFIFGRGGEEQAFLQERGIRVHVVPGITAAAGICAQLGIPLTHRGHATGVRYMTGHMREGAEDELRVSLEECGDPMTTLVFYMGLATLPMLRAKLLAAGADPELPAVAVERGTTPEQREVWAPLCEFVEAVEDAGLRSPTLIVMGQVVALAEGWEGASNTATAMPAPLTSEQPREGAAVGSS